MFYPQEFTTRIKAFCADKDPIIKGFMEECLEKGSVDLGLFLKYGFSKTFSYFDVLEAKSLEELQARAKKKREVYELEQEWKKLYKEQTKMTGPKNSR